MGYRGGFGSSGVPLEGPFNLNTSVATATATTVAAGDSVLCRGARAVYFVIYDKTFASASTFGTSTCSAITQPGGTAASVLNDFADCVIHIPGGVTAAVGGIMSITPRSSSQAAGSVTDRSGRLMMYALTPSAVFAAGVTPANIAIDAYVDWGG